MRSLIRAGRHLIRPAFALVMIFVATSSVFAQYEDE